MVYLSVLVETSVLIGDGFHKLELGYFVTSVIKSIKGRRNSISNRRKGWSECALLVEGLGLTIVEDVEDRGEGFLLCRGRCKVDSVLSRIVRFSRTIDIVFTRA